MTLLLREIAEGPGIPDGSDDKQRAFLRDLFASISESDCHVRIYLHLFQFLIRQAAGGVHWEFIEEADIGLLEPPPYPDVNYTEAAWNRVEQWDHVVSLSERGACELYKRALREKSVCLADGSRLSDRVKDLLSQSDAPSGDLETLLKDIDTDLEERKAKVGDERGRRKLDGALRCFSLDLELERLRESLLMEAERMLGQLVLKPVDGPMDCMEVYGLKGRFLKILPFHNGAHLQGQRKTQGIGETTPTRSKTRSGKPVRWATQDTFDRPVYMLDRGDTRVIHFFNSPDGHFFVQDAEETTRLNDTVNNVVLDFPAMEITYLHEGKRKKAPISARQGSPVQQYFDHKVKNETIWHAFGFNIQLSWFAVYGIHHRDGKREVNAHLLWQAVGGGGHGIGRADPVAPDLALWRYEGPDQFSRLGEFIGLVEESRITSAYPPWSVHDGLMRYSGISIEGTKYVEVNLPFSWPSDGGSAPNNPIDDAWARDVLTVFNFRYFRQLDRNDRVIKRGDNKRNKPTLSEAPGNGKEYVALSPPICFRNQQNLAAYKKNAARASRCNLKNKGGNLFRKNPVPRVSPGAVMRGLTEQLTGVDRPSLSGGALSATQFSRWLLRTRPSPLNDLRALKPGLEDNIRTDQEWCHLKGHGDSGKDRPGNLASGSKHCNTEQLAIEIGQRGTTHKVDAGTFTLKTTAYLLNDESLTDGWIEALDAEYLKAAQQSNDTDGDASMGDGDPALKPEHSPLNNAPIAAFIRYKIYRKKESGGATKILDYVFEGQSEFFDVNQYRILNATVRFLLEGREAFEAWYERQMNEADASAKVSVKKKASSR